MDSFSLEEIEKTDLNKEQSDSLQDYLKNGRPGLTTVKDTDVFKWIELYMSGTSYEEIAKITNSKRDLILYISVKGKWYEKRMSYYESVANNLGDKIKQTKLNSINTVTSAINALGKYYGDKFNKFIATKDEGVIEGIDTKLLSQYYKSIEIVEKMIGNSTKPGQNGSPQVNINVNSNSKVEQTGDDTVEITEDNLGDILKYLANKKRPETDTDEN